MPDITSGGDSPCVCDNGAQPLRLAERVLLCVGINALTVIVQATEIVDRRRPRPAVSGLGDRGPSGHPVAGPA